MLELPGLLLDHNYIGAVLLLGISAVGVLIFLAPGRWFGFKSGPPAILAALALVETCWQIRRDPGPFVRFDWVLFPAWRLPVLIATGVIVSLLILRSALPESYLPLRGRWLTRLLVALGTAGIIVAGPCLMPLWYDVEALGIWRFVSFSHDLLPAPPTSAWQALRLWVSFLLGIPYLLITHWALLESVHLLVERRVAPRLALRIRQAGATTAAYGKALARNESLW